MPADITGTNVFNMQANEFTLIKGPVFTTFLLADEINRAPAKTQSALLQAMQERKVTIDRDTHTLSPNFTVFATQNPVEYEGTYPLPEAQKDRFMLKVRCSRLIATASSSRATQHSNSPEERWPPASSSRSSPPRISSRCASPRGHHRARRVLCSPVVDVVRATRTNDTSPSAPGRATQALLLASRATAAPLAAIGAPTT
jgi:MoxR-like ATPase